MKIYVIALLFVTAVAFALPIEDGVHLELQLANEDEILEVAPAEKHHSEHFLICDIPILGINRTICGILCITKGYDGGSCTNSVCICKKNN